jgi:hypothetical protein
MITKELYLDNIERYSGCVYPGKLFSFWSSVLLFINVHFTRGSVGLSVDESLGFLYTHIHLAEEVII